MQEKDKKLEELRESMRSIQFLLNEEHKSDYPSQESISLSEDSMYELQKMIDRLEMKESEYDEKYNEDEK